jgi:integrase
MKTNDGIGGSIHVKNGKYFISLNGKKYYTKISVSKIGFKIASEYKKKLFLQSLGIINDEKKEETKYYIKDVFQKYIDEIKINRLNPTIELKIYSFQSIVNENYELNHKNIENSIVNFLKNKMDVRNTTKNTYMRNFQIFLNYLYRNEYLKPSINYKQKYLLKEKKKENTYFELSELNIMLNYLRNNIQNNTLNCNNSNILTSNNDKLPKNVNDCVNSSNIEINTNLQFANLLEFMYFTGARITETLNIKVSDIEKDKIKMYNKINKEIEYIYLNERIIKLIKEMIKGKSKEDKLFTWKPSSSHFLLKKLKQVMRACKIEINGRNIHSLRKSYLKYLLSKNIPVEIAQRFMRHSNIKTTLKNYYSIREIELKEYAKNL